MHKGPPPPPFPMPPPVPRPEDPSPPAPPPEPPPEPTPEPTPEPRPKSKEEWEEAGPPEEVPRMEETVHRAAVGSRRRDDDTLRLFPSIEASDEQPVEGETIDVTVSLGSKAARHTSGEVVLPAELPDFTLDVLLLVGAERRFDTLEYESGKGTVKPAKFEGVEIPDLEEVRAGERNRLLIRANFFFANKWCGEGIRNLEVRQSRDVDRVSAVEPPAEPPWRGKLFVKDAEAADLTVVVLKDLSVQDRYVWSFMSPHDLKEGIAKEHHFSSLGGTPLHFLQARIRTVSESPEALRARRMKGLFGQQVYDAAARAFREVYWDLFRRDQSPLKTIQFITDEPFVPWELMRPRDGDDTLDFLGIQHAVGRWVLTESCRMEQELDVEHIAVFASDYKGTGQNPLPGALEEREHLVGRWGAQASDVEVDPILEFFRNGGPQVAHFACHGEVDTADPDLSKLLTVPSGELIPADLDGLDESHIGDCKPLVFLNACELGGAGNVLSVVGGWPKSFTRAGAAAFIGTLWAVNDEEAHEIGKEFYDRAFDDAAPTVGEVMQAIRAQWETRGLTRLAYVLYGDPRLRLRRV